MTDHLDRLHQAVVTAAGKTGEIQRVFGIPYAPEGFLPPQAIHDVNAVVAELRTARQRLAEMEGKR